MGREELRRRSRLLDETRGQGADLAIEWEARGECVPVAGAQPAIWLHLKAHAVLPLTCQRCLQPMTVELHVSPTLRFVRDEALAEQLDEDSEEDVLALSAALDLHDLVEDELILALPLVPRHEHCPQPLPMSAGDLDGPAEGDSQHAFASLAGLLRKTPGQPD